VFQILKDPQLNFMRRGKQLLGVSTVLVLVATVIVFVVGLNLGIEFTGGTELQLKYHAAPDIAGIRSTLASAGLTSQTVTSIGEPADNEVYIRIGTSGAPGEEVAEDRDPTTRVLTALGAGLGDAADLNLADQATLRSELLGAPGMTDAAANELAAAVLERRREVRIIDSVADLSDVPGMTREVQDYLQDTTRVGPFALRSQSYVGPAIGDELKTKAGLAIIGSLFGMLIYIWIRFQLQWGFAAVAALAHDTLMTLGLFAIFGKEMSLPVVAAFLTLVGYSVNDTVVVFDRIRENLKKMQGQSLEAVINASINQTLSRTIITSGLTLVVVLALLLFGGSALNPFAFVLSAGVIVGTYSSIYIASPILVLWQRYVTGRKAGSRGSSRKVSPSAAS
jgi:preprotein translocase subunit SecF